MGCGAGRDIDTREEASEDVVKSLCILARYDNGDVSRLKESRRNNRTYPRLRWREVVHVNLDRLGRRWCDEGSREQETNGGCETRHGCGGRCGRER